MTFSEYVAVIFLLPISMAAIYSMIVIFWMAIRTQMAVEKFTSIFKRERTRDDTSSRDRD